EDLILTSLTSCPGDVLNGGAYQRDIEEGTWNTLACGSTAIRSAAASSRGKRNEVGGCDEAAGPPGGSPRSADRLRRWRHDFDRERGHREVRGRRRRHIRPGDRGEEGRQAQHHRHPAGLGQLPRDQ